MTELVRDRVLEVLRAHPRQAMFLPELHARLRPVDDEQLDRAVAALDGSQVLVVDHPSPDVHLQGDLRVIALVADAPTPGPARTAAHRAAEAVWSAWLRDVLAHHRCS